MKKTTKTKRAKICTSFYYIFKCGRRHQRRHHMTFDRFCPELDLCNPVIENLLLADNVANPLTN